EVGRDDSQHESPGALAMRPRTTGAPVGESDPEVYWQASEDQGCPCRVLRALDEGERAAGPAAGRRQRIVADVERGHRLAAGAHRHAGLGAVPEVGGNRPALRPEADRRVAL